MKYYDFALAPNPRRVRIFAAEKGIALDSEQINVREGEQFAESYRAINPNCSVPTLVLDDGTCLTETTAICRYLEEIQPEPALLGRDAKEKAVIEMWHKRCELEGLGACAEALRNTAPRFVDHAVPGTQKIPQIPALAERGQMRAAHFFETLNARLEESEYVGGDRFSIADILALVVMDFAKMVEAQPADSATAVKAWYDKVSSRPSAKA